MALSDQGLVRSAVGGNADALAALLQGYGPSVERTLRIDATWRAALDAADIMQVTYIEAFQRIQTFDPNRADRFEGWLRQIAENNLRDAIRGLERQKRPHPARRMEALGSTDSVLAVYEHLAVTTTTPSRNASRQEIQTALEAALNRLPEDYARVVRACDLQGCPVPEVAKEMGRSSGAVHMLRARAHDRLREVLGSESCYFTATG